MDTGASAIDHPDPTIVDFVESSRLMPRGMSASGDSMGYSGEPESSSGRVPPNGVGAVGK